jgi:protein-tyrosine-phosphatase
MAEAIAKNKINKNGLEKSVKVSSAGLNILAKSGTAKESIAALKKLGITARKSNAKQIENIKGQRNEVNGKVVKIKGDVNPESFSYVVCMTAAHKQVLENHFHNARVFTFNDICGGGDIGDPIGMGIIEYEKVALDLNKKIDIVFDRLITII